MAVKVFLISFFVIFRADICHTKQVYLSGRDYVVRGRNVACLPSSEWSDRMSCGPGVWPGSADPEIRVPTDPDTNGRPLKDLAIEYATLRADNLQPLPNVEFSTLTFADVTTVDSNLRQVTLPLREFLRNFPKHAVKSFFAYSVMLGVIDVNTFDGFSGLESITLADASITQIHRDSFQHFALNTAGVGLRYFSIQYETELVSFPWDSLRFFTTSLKRIDFARVEKLANFTLSIPAGEIKFDAFEELVIAETLVTTISPDILATLSSSAATVVVKGTPTITFEQNYNFCVGYGGEGLGSLIAWVKGSPTGTRYLYATCNTEVHDSGYIERSELYGTSEDWETCHADDKPVCNTGY